MKASYLHRFLSIVCDGKTQALMRLDIATRSAALSGQQGLNLVFVDYLQTAPWNWAYPQCDPPLYEQLGTNLIVAAVEISIAEGFKGRLGLESLPQSDGFYRKLGMHDLGPLIPPHHLRYFEFSSEAAKKFLERSQS